MIKVTSDNGNSIVEMEGTALALATDVCLIMQAVYDGIKKQDKDAANAFRFCVLELLNGNEIMQ